MSWRNLGESSGGSGTPATTSILYGSTRRNVSRTRDGGCIGVVPYPDAFQLSQGAWAKRRCALEEVSFTLTGTNQFTLNTYSFVSVGGSNYREFTIYRNGAIDQYVVVTLGAQSQVITLGGTGGTIKIIEGLQTRDSGGPIGSFIDSIEVASPGSMSSFRSERAQQSTTAVIMGDSISVGDGATHPGSGGWSSLLRESQSTKAIYVDGYGNRALVPQQLYEPPSELMAQSTFGAVLGASTCQVLVALGTNDYGLATCSAATFRTTLLALCQRLRALKSNIDIWCLSPTPRTGEASANAFGDALPAYRTAMSNAVADANTAAGATYCHYIDGNTITGWTNGTCLSGDGLHPNDTGHQKIKDYIVAAGF